MQFLRSTLVLVAALMLALHPCSVVEAQSQSSVCFLYYSAPGVIEYPWSVAVSLLFSYDVPTQTNSLGTYQPFYNAFGSYTYTNKFGHSTSHTVYQGGSVGNLYIDSPFPVDSQGLDLSVYGSTNVQLPGVGPVNTYDEIFI